MQGIFRGQNRTTIL